MQESDARYYTNLNKRTANTLRSQTNNLRILDGIYRSTEMKIDKLLSQKRLEQLQGKQLKKTLAEERLEMILDKNTQL